MSDDNMDAPRKKRGRPPKIPAPLTDDKALAFVNEWLNRPIDCRTESRKLEPTTDILMIIGEFSKWGCEKPEIAAVLGVTVGALEDFMIMSEPGRHAYERGHQLAKIRIRIGQFQIKQANMSIFLGKNKLGQKDEVTTNVKTNTGDIRDLSEEELMEIAKQGLKDLRSARKMN